MQGKNLEKIVVSAGVGRLRQRPGFDENVLPLIEKELMAITGQKPAPRAARKSIAGFKIRAGDIVGLKVTLRGKRMDDFLKKLVGVVIPRIRDFHGIDPKQIDSEGNLTIGIREHIVFPEVNPDEVKFDFGFEITLVSKIKDKEEAYELFKSLGVPLKNK
jgi:large subunit ribosomal protein L5